MADEKKIENIHSLETNNSMWTNLSRLIKEIMKFRGLLAISLISVIISTVFVILGPRELGKATSTIFEGVVHMVKGTGTVNMDEINRILLTVLILYLISTTFNIIQGYVMTTITENVAYGLRKQLMDKVNKLPMGYFESRPVGETLSRIVNDIDTLGASMSQSASELVTSIATVIGITIIMYTINPIMATIIFILLPLSWFLIKMITKYSQRYFRQQQATLGVVNGHVEEVYSGQKVVKAFNQEENMFIQFDKQNQKLKQSAWKSQFYSGIMFPLMRFISQMGYVAVVMVGAFMVAIGQMRVGEIQAFTQYVNRFTQPIIQMSMVVNLLQSMSAASERVFELIDEEEEDQTVGEQLNLNTIHGDVEFDHISFGYQKDQKIIHDFTAEVNSGSKVALVGPTGAGKSTVVKLLMRFYDVDSGSILIDEEPIRKYSRESYQQSMSMVLQDTWLFKGSIMDNIRYGRLEASEEEVIEAAKSARVHHFIQSLPGGYQFELSDDAANISQGQRQLLTIARAILADRPVLVLDEATSSVDTRTEILIQEAMDELMAGRTSFVIAHRLSTIKDSDLILYMEQGDIVEQGNHESLMALNGRYASLYNSQFAN